MNPRLKIITLPILFFAFQFSSGSTENCINDPDFYQFLNGKIGSGNPDKPEFFLMECDTMVVNKGITVQLSQNTYLAFADPKAGNTLIVKGTFIVEGDNTKKSYISNSLDTVLFSPSQLNAKWDGIIIEKEGQLTLINGMVYGSAAPIRSKSKDIQISNSYFYGADNIIHYKEKPIILNSNKYLAEFNLAAYLDNQAASQIPKAKAPPPRLPEEKKEETKFWKSPWPYLGVIALGGGAAAYFVFNLSESPAEKARNSAVSEEDFYDQPNQLNEELESGLNPEN